MNHFGGPGSILSAGCSESEPGCEIFAPVPDAALNGCILHVKPDFNFNFRMKPKKDKKRATKTKDKKSKKKTKKEKSECVK